MEHVCLFHCYNPAPCAEPDTEFAFVALFSSLMPSLLQSPSASYFPLKNALGKRTNNFIYKISMVNNTYWAPLPLGELTF